MKTKTRFHKLTGWLIALTMLFAILPCTAITANAEAPTDTWHDYAADSFEDGDGTLTEPYVIKTAEQLAKLSKDVMEGNAYKDTYFILDDDINLSGHRWIPIGVHKWTADGTTVNKPFSGSFDGNEKTVSNMYIDSALDDDYYSGFFGSISNYQATVSPVIKDLTIDNAIINYNAENQSDSISGIFAGRIGGNENPRVQISNVIVSNSTLINTAENANYAYQSGAFAGYLDYALIQNCHTKNVTVTGGANNGGFVGLTTFATYEDCSANGNVSGQWGLGGFVGNAVDNSSFTKCIADVNVTADNWNAGGFCGLAICGVEFNKCVAYGDIQSTVTTFEPKLGGFAGSLIKTYIDPYLVEPSSMTKCYFAGTLTSAHETIKPSGLVAVVEESTITDCAYDGELNTDITGYTDETESTALSTKNLELEICVNVLDGHNMEDSVCSNCGYTEYGIYVNGIQVTSANAADVLGTADEGATVTYDAETNTLTLDGINITSGYKDENDRVIGIYADGDLNIELAGENDITMPDDNNKSYGIRVKGDLSISGSGSLNVVAGNVTAQDSEEHYSTGIHTSGYLNIYGATVYAKGSNVSAEGESYSRGVYLGGGLQVDFGGSLTAEGGNANGSIAYSTGLEALGEEEYINISIYDGNLIGKGGDTEGVIIAESNGVYLEIAGFYVYENTANVELTCGNAKVTSDDESAEPYAYSNGITVYEGDIAIYGGTVEITGGTWEGIDGDGWAVYVDGEEDEEGVITGGSVLIEWKNIELSPSGYGFIGPKVTITSTDEEKGAVFAENGLEIGDKLIISEPENGEIAKIEEENYTFDTVLNADGSLAKKVVIAPLIYSVKIEGLDYGMSVLVPDNTSINEAYKDMLEEAEITDFSDTINTEKSGYTFNGFYTESGEKFDFDDSVISDMTITAKWTKKSYGGGSSSTTTTTTKNDDGSTTKTTTNKATGTTTETTTYPDGSTTKVETKKDGTVTTTEKDKDGNTTTTVEKPDGTSTTTEKNKDGSEKVTEEKADGTTVTTEKDTDGTKTVTTENADGSTTTEETKKDGTKVTTETNADGETTAEVEAKGETEVVIPVDNAEDVTSITVTDKDGKETEITDFEITDDGVKISVSGDCTAAINKAAKKEFADVHPVNHWATADIDYAYIKGLMMGTSETHFSPDVPLTRAMLVTVLYRLEGEPEMKNAQWFEDVEKGQWYSDAVAWATFNGITMGYGNGNFGPDDNITREQIAAIMHRYAQYKGYDVSVGENTNILSYDDFDSIPEYAIASMQYAAGSGLMKGKTTSTLNPLDNATRAEIAAILHRFTEANK